MIQCEPMFFAVMVSMILKTFIVKYVPDKKQKIKANICQKDIVQCRRLRKLSFVGLMMRFSYFLNQLINAKCKYEYQRRNRESVRSKYERIQEMLIES